MTTGFLGSVWSGKRFFFVFLNKTLFEKAYKWKLNISAILYFIVRISITYKGFPAWREMYGKCTQWSTRYTCRKQGWPSCINKVWTVWIFLKFWSVTNKTIKFSFMQWVLSQNKCFKYQGTYGCFKGKFISCKYFMVQLIFNCNTFNLDALLKNYISLGKMFIYKCGKIPKLYILEPTR